MMRTKAFTLLELLITLAIIAILTGIAYPSYQSYLIRSRRTNAKITLLKTASALENYFMEHHTYTGATFSNLKILSQTSSSNYYLELAQLNDEHYLIEAIPQNSQIKDTDCSIFKLNDLGEKFISGNGLLKECWL